LKKVFVAAFLASLLAILVSPVLHASTQSPVPAAHRAASPREVTPLDSGWLFLREDAQGAEKTEFDTSKWQGISLPHTFDAADGDAGDHFYRGPAWYRRIIAISALDPAKRTFIEFDGAALSTQVWLNGRSVGRHDGGFARFRFDLTPYLSAGENVLAVRVDNSRNETIASLTGDFAVYGGLYRRVRLISTRDVHFDMMDYGSSGVQLHATEFDSNRAVVKAAVRITNDSAKDVDAELVATIRNAGGIAAATKTVPVKVHAGATIAVDFEAEVSHPHLWNGVHDPYLYQVDFALAGSRKEKLDSIAVPFGIRTIQITPESGLLLNGKPYAVHGVAIHQAMRPGRGPAVDDADVKADYVMLREMGATGLRFAHYQHGPTEYDLADRMGFLVWTEVPMVGEAGGSDAFRANLTQQMRELIRQNVNHPSVMVWGLGNETKDTPEVYKALAVNEKTAHEEDASRPTTYAACCGPADDPRTKYSDVIAYNQYLGWYRGEIGDWSQWLDDFHQQNGHKPMAISEYGAGASVFQQEDPVHRPDARGHWHPEQWQALVHEGAWRQLSAKPYLWASFIWVGFDFPSMGRDEGDHKGRNDKGLITFDRAVRKDAYFWYQANWTEKPMVYITSRRYAVRSNQDVEVKVYSNQPKITLQLNGKSIGTLKVVGHIAAWQVKLQKGPNRIEATAGPARDHVAWEYKPGSVPPGPPAGNAPPPATSQQK
jgi:beta-galactosidase